MAQPGIVWEGAKAELATRHPLMMLPFPGVHALESLWSRGSEGWLFHLGARWRCRVANVGGRWREAERGRGDQGGVGGGERKGERQQVRGAQTHRREALLAGASQKKTHHWVDHLPPSLPSSFQEGITFMSSSILLTQGSGTSTLTQ